MLAIGLKNFAIVLLVFLITAHLFRTFALSISVKKFHYVPWVTGIAVVEIAVNLFLNEVLTSLVSFMIANADLPSKLTEGGNFIDYIDMIVNPPAPPVTIETVSATAITEFVLALWSAFVFMIGGAIIDQPKPSFKGTAAEFAAIFKSWWWIILAVVVVLAVVFTALTFTHIKIEVPFIGTYNAVFAALILLLLRFRIYKKRI